MESVSRTTIVYIPLESVVVPAPELLSTLTEESVCERLMAYTVPVIFICAKAFPCNNKKQTGNKKNNIGLIKDCKYNFSAMILRQVS